MSFTSPSFEAVEVRASVKEELAIVVYESPPHDEAVEEGEAYSAPATPTAAEPQASNTQCGVRFIVFTF